MTNLPKELRLYLKYRDQYTFVSFIQNDGVASGEYKGKKFRKIIIDQGIAHLLPSLNASNIHTTYPEDGDVHQTFDFRDGKKIYILEGKISMQLPRNFENVEIPTKTDLLLMSHMSPHWPLPAFAEVSSKFRYQLNVMAGQVAQSSMMFMNPARPSAGATILDVTPYEGMTLNLMTFVCGSSDFNGPFPDVIETYICGSQAPFTGVQVLAVPKK